MHDPLPNHVCRWGMWCHLTGLCWILLFVIPVPYLCVLICYIVWRRGRTIHPFVDAQGKEALNFQISIALYLTCIVILGFFLFFLTCGVAFSNPPNNELLNAIGIAGFVFATIGVIILIFQTVCSIFAAIKAIGGQSYRYPFTLRFFQ